MLVAIVVVVKADVVVVVVEVVVVVDVNYGLCRYCCNEGYSRLLPPIPTDLPSVPKAKIFATIASARRVIVASVKALRVTRRGGGGSG